MKGSQNLVRPDKEVSHAGPPHLRGVAPRGHQLRATQADQVLQCFGALRGTHVLSSCFLFMKLHIFTKCQPPPPLSLPLPPPSPSIPFSLNSHCRSLQLWCSTTCRTTPSYGGSYPSSRSPWCTPCSTTPGGPCSACPPSSTALTARSPPPPQEQLDRRLTIELQMP